MTRFLRFVKCHTPGLHPGFDDLVTWADRTSEPPPAVVVHLGACSRCMQQAQLIRTVAERAADPACSRRHKSMVDGVFEALQAEMNAWSSLQEWKRTRSAQKSYPHVNVALTRAVELYFGRGTARRIESASFRKTPDESMLPAIKPLFSSFLGSRAADALSRRLLGAAG